VFEQFVGLEDRVDANLGCVHPWKMLDHYAARAIVECEIARVVEDIHDEPDMAAAVEMEMVAVSVGVARFPEGKP